jgi:hypothetical protein
VRSTIAGGNGNNIGTKSYYSAIGGGYDNGIAADSSSATIAGGYSNNIFTNSSNSTVGGGRVNNIGANLPDATIGGGYQNAILFDAECATIPGGRYARATAYGQMAYASGPFSGLGDAQTSVFVARGTTSGLMTGELFLDGASKRMTVPVNTTWTFEILVVARSTAGEVAGYTINGLINGAGNTTSLPGFTVNTIYESDPNWGVSVSADDVNDALVIRATGNTGDTIRWVASIRTAEVRY